VRVTLTTVSGKGRNGTLGRENVSCWSWNFGVAGTVRNGNVKILFENFFKEKKFGCNEVFVSLDIEGPWIYHFMYVLRMSG